MVALRRFWSCSVLIVLGLVGSVVAGSAESGLEADVVLGRLLVERGSGGLGQVGGMDIERGAKGEGWGDTVLNTVDWERSAEANNQSEGTVIQAQLSRIYPLTPPALLLKHSVVTATLVFYLYDYLCTLDYEVKYIWTRPWSVGTLLFALNRYLPFIDLGICMHALKVIRTPEQCHKEYSILTWINTFGIIVSQIVLLLRTLAIWERKPLMVWLLLALFLCTATPSLIIVHFYLKTLYFVPVNPLIKYGCSLESSSGLLLINYVLVLFSETTIVILTFIRGIKHLRHSNSHWVRELYASGFAFYVFLLVVTVANLIYPFVASPSLKSLFSDPQRALHALLCNHVIFVICSRQRPSNHNDMCDLTTTTSRNHNANDDYNRTEYGNTFVLSTVLDTFVTDDGYGRDDGYVGRDSERYDMQEVGGRRREDEDDGDKKAGTTTTLSGTWEEERREREV